MTLLKRAYFESSDHRVGSCGRFTRPFVEACSFIHEMSAVIFVKRTLILIYKWSGPTYPTLCVLYVRLTFCSRLLNLKTKKIVIISPWVYSNDGVRIPSINLSSFGKTLLYICHTPPRLGKWVPGRIIPLMYCALITDAVRSQS